MRRAGLPPLRWLSENSYFYSLLLNTVWDTSKRLLLSREVAKLTTEYAVAKERCDDQAGNAKDVCVKQAKSAQTAAKANAKVQMETAEATSTATEKTVKANTKANEKITEVRKDAAADKRDAEYAVAIEKCDALAGDAKSTCVGNAKATYGKKS